MSPAFAALFAVLMGWMTAVLPQERTPVAQLHTASLQHLEVLRIKRDFGKRGHDIVVDSWADRVRARVIADVRMWWVKADRGDERAPFSRKVMRYLDLRYASASADAWTVELTGDRKMFRFSVELDDSGHAGAYVAVVTDRGRRIEHCRADSATLRARRFLGIPVGIGELRVHCVDDRGRGHDGVMPYRKTRRGLVYRP